MKYLDFFYRTNMSRAKSTSSLVEDEAPKFKIGIQRTKMRSSERSASLENLLDTSQGIYDNVDCSDQKFNPSIYSVLSPMLGFSL